MKLLLGQVCFCVMVAPVILLCDGKILASSPGYL